jgi:hypothetical protein
MDHIEARHLGACDPNVADRFLQSSPSASTTVSASWTSRTRRESPRMEPFVRAAGRYQPAAPRKARASVQGALAPSCTGASDNDRSPPDLIPDLTNARTPLVAISFCTEGGGPPGSRTAFPSGNWRCFTKPPATTERAAAPTTLAFGARSLRSGRRPSLLAKLLVRGLGRWWSPANRLLRATLSRSLSRWSGRTQGQPRHHPAKGERRAAARGAFHRKPTLSDRWRAALLRCRMAVPSQSAFSTPVPPGLDAPDITVARTYSPVRPMVWCEAAPFF